MYKGHGRCISRILCHIPRYLDWSGRLQVDVRSTDQNILDGASMQSRLCSFADTHRNTCLEQLSNEPIASTISTAQDVVDMASFMALN